ncbi:MAG: alpha/beta fold hydrolase [Vicingaceae bacterium]
METLVWTFLILIVLAGLFAGVLLTFYLLQEKIIFSPIKLTKNYLYPFEGEFEERFYEVDINVSLNCLLFKAKNSKGLIFYIHGNADNLRYWGDFAPFFVNLGYDVFMYDFRGFGKSDGRIKGERMLLRDAKRIYEIMLKEYDALKIHIYGFSLGTGIAARLAHNQPFANLFLEAPYYNFLKLINYHKAYLPASWITKYHFRTNKYLKDIEQPIHIFHGTEDRKVPFYLGKELKDLHPKINFYKVDGATHNEMQEMELFQLKMADILV